MLDDESKIMLVDLEVRGKKSDTLLVEALWLMLQSGTKNLYSYFCYLVF